MEGFDVIINLIVIGVLIYFIYKIYHSVINTYNK